MYEEYDVKIFRPDAFLIIFLPSFNFSLTHHRRRHRHHHRHQIISNIIYRSIFRCHMVFIGKKKHTNISKETET